MSYEFNIKHALLEYQCSYLSDSLGAREILIAQLVQYRQHLPTLWTVDAKQYYGLLENGMLGKEWIGHQRWMFKGPKYWVTRKVMNNDDDGMLSDKWHELVKRMYIR